MASSGYSSRSSRDANSSYEVHSCWNKGSNNSTFGETKSYTINNYNNSYVNEQKIFFDDGYNKQKSKQPSPNASTPSPLFNQRWVGAGGGVGAQREGDKKVQQITFLHSEGRYNHGDSAGAAVLMNTATYWFPFVFSSSPLSPASSVIFSFRFRSRHTYSLVSFRSRSIFPLFFLWYSFIFLFLILLSIFSQWYIL